MAMIGMSAASLSAQRVKSSIDLTGTGVWYADTIRATGTSIAPAFRLDWPTASLDGSFAFSRLGAGRSSIQGSLTPSLSTPSIGPFSAELGGAFGGSSHHDGTRTGSALGMARVYATKATASAWIGVGGGSTWDDSVWRSVRQSEAGAWVQRNNFSAAATVDPITVADTLSYTDTQVALRYETSVFAFDVTGGWRAGSVGPEIGGTRRTWGSLSGLLWLSDRVAIVASGGSYPVDFTQGYPGGRFATLALRLSSRSSRRAVTVASSRDTTNDRTVERGLPVLTDFVVRTDSGVHRSIRVEALGANTVEISGDFTQWRPVRLVQGADGSWTASFPIALGTHQVNLRINGGEWVAPPGLLTSRDEFGGVVGILVVE
jgi:hypothetical protein